MKQDWKITIIECVNKMFTLTDNSAKKPQIGNVSMIFKMWKSHSFKTYIKVFGVTVNIFNLQDKLAFQSKAYHRRICVFSYTRISHFCFCNLDLDHMTLICERDLDILKIYLRAKMKFLGKSIQKLEHEQDRQTDTQTHRQTDATERITSGVVNKHFR